MVAYEAPVLVVLLSMLVVWASAWAVMPRMGRGRPLPGSVMAMVSFVVLGWGL